MRGDPPEFLFLAGEDVETEEDHHLYHARGFCRDLWLHSLGLPALPPPPEDQKELKSGISVVPARAAN